LNRDDYAVDATFDASRLPGFGVYSGFDEFNAAWSAYRDTFDDWWIEVEELLDGKGDRVFAAVRTAVGSRRLAPKSVSRSSTCQSFGRGRPLSGRRSWSGPKPSKPPGCGSRRCRRRTWRSCVGCTTL
jgi:hypothetical protein